jgi:hypothetical protein
MEIQIIIDNLAYVMLSMAEKEETATNGIGCLVYLKDWAMENYSVESCMKLLEILEGGIPVRVSHFFLVNPPSWFESMWKIVKPLLHPTFQRRIKLLPERVLSQVLAPGYQAYLPNDMSEGSVNATQLVHDFVAYRKHIEREK